MGWIKEDRGGLRRRSGDPGNKDRCEESGELKIDENGFDIIRRDPGQKSMVILRVPLGPHQRVGTRHRSRRSIVDTGTM